MFKSMKLLEAPSTEKKRELSVLHRCKCLLSEDSKGVGLASSNACFLPCPSKTQVFALPGPVGKGS